MNMGWGLQKLGQGVIGINGKANVTTQESETVLGTSRHNVYSGIDGRLNNGQILNNVDSDECDELHILNINFKKNDLLGKLVSSSLSEIEKIERVTLASSVESLLPCSLSSTFPSAHINVASMVSGNLMNDWKFEF